MSQLLGVLKLSNNAWDRYDRAGTALSATLTAVGGYALLAFDRFGAQGILAPRGPVRMMLVGFYGWLFIAAVAWVLARSIHHTEVRYTSVLRLFGFIHVPVLMLAIVIQFFSVSLRFFAPAGFMLLFGFLVWMPGLTVFASRKAFGVGRSRAAVVGLVAYLFWVVSVGWWMWTQIGHLT